MDVNSDKNRAGITLVNGNAVAYDVENHATSLAGGAWTYAFDGLGQRVQKKPVSGNSTAYVYDAFGQLAAEYANGTSWARDYDGGDPCLDDPSFCAIDPVFTGIFLENLPPAPPVVTESKGGNPLPPGSFPNGETLGLPLGLGVPSTLQLLLGVNSACEFGVCGSGIAPNTGYGGRSPCGWGTGVPCLDPAWSGLIGLNWSRGLQYFSCIAGTDPGLMVAASQPGDTSDTSPDYKSPQRKPVYGPGRGQKSGGQAPINPGPQSDPDNGVNLLQYSVNVAQCVAAVNSQPSRKEPKSLQRAFLRVQD